MLHRRSFIGAVLGAATFPIPALARSEPSLTRTKQIYLNFGPLSGAFPYPGGVTLARLPTGPLLAVWDDIVPHNDSVSVEAVAGRYDLSLNEIARPIAAGTSSGSLALAVSTTGGLLQLGGADRRVRPISFAGAPILRARRYDSASPDVGNRPAGVCPLPNGTFLAAWIASTTDGASEGVVGAVFGPDGTKRSRFVWIVAPAIKAPRRGVLLHALLPLGGGAVGIFSRSTSDRRFLLRRADAFGNWGPGRVLGISALPGPFEGADTYAFAPVGTDRVAGVWRDGWTLEGGLFDLDGNRLTTFERVEGEEIFPTVLPEANAIVSLPGHRILCLPGPHVFDVESGKLVARPALSVAPPGSVTAVVPFGVGQFALTTYSPEANQRTLETYRWVE